MQKHFKGYESLPQIQIIPISFQPVGVNLCHYKLIIRPKIIHSLKYLRSKPLGCNDMRISVCGKDSIPLNFKETYFEDK